MLLTGMGGASWLARLGSVLLGTTFLCSRGGLPSGLASALLFDKLSLLISFSSFGISSLNLKAPRSTNLGLYVWNIKYGKKKTTFRSLDEMWISWKCSLVGSRSDSWISIRDV